MRSSCETAWLENSPVALVESHSEFEEDENTRENNCSQAKKENNEETKNRGDTTRTHSVLPGNIVPDDESGAESGAVQVALCRVFDSWGSLTADDRRRILAIIDGRMA